MKIEIVKTNPYNSNPCGILMEKVKDAFDLLETVVSAAASFNVDKGSTFTIDLSFGDSDVPSAIFAFERIAGDVWGVTLNFLVTEVYFADYGEILEWLDKWLERIGGAKNGVFQIEKVFEDGIAASYYETFK